MTAPPQAAAARAAGSRPADATRPPPRSPLLERSTLNSQQQEAVCHTSGPLLVFAGPGTGKTDTLAHKIAYLIEQEICWSQRIAAITFTRRAADEMRSRLVQLVENPHVASEVTVATTHSLCYRILRAHPEPFGRTTKCDIYNPPRVARLARAILRHPAHRGLAELAHELEDPPVDELLREISLAKNRLWTPERYRERSDSKTAPLVAPLWETLDRQLVAANVFDFDDLLCLTARLLGTDEQLRAHYAERYEQLLIDEYQDLNEAQIQIVRSLKPPGGNLSAFADDDQALYRWRGADPENVLRFRSDFPGTRTITFTENYRCRREILDAAIRVISNNKRRHHKPLKATRGRGGYLGVRRLRSDEEEAGEVAEIMSTAISCGREPKEILVLSRTTAPLARLQPQLVERGIKVRLVGGQSLWERSEIKDAISYLQLLKDPYDTEAFTRALRCPTDRTPFKDGEITAPTRGAGEATADAIAAFAASKRIDLLAATARCAEIRGVAAESRVAIREFAQHLQQIRASSFAEDTSVASLVGRTLRMPAGVIDCYELLSTSAREWRVRDDANRVLEDLRSLSRSASRYEQDAIDEEPTLLGFLDSLGLDETEELDAEHDDRISLMTIHGSKGCQATTVLLIASEEDVIPGRRQRATAEGLEDERRLFYTALTRAKDTAILLYVDRRAGEPTEGASRFHREAGLYR